MSEPITTDHFTVNEVLQTVEVIHDVLEKFTPSEAVHVLTVVRADLETEIRDSLETDIWNNVR